MLFDDFSLVAASHFPADHTELSHNPLLVGHEAQYHSLVQSFHDGRSHPANSNQTALMTMAAATTADSAPIYVVGNRITSGDPPAGNPDGNQEDKFSPAPEGGGSGYPDPKDTPCVESTFSTPDVSLTEANRAALAASASIAALNDETYEYSSLVFTLNGYIGFTNPYTDGHFDDVNLLGSLASVPDGAVIIGTVHNHPDDPLMNDTIPSGGGSSGQDWSAYNQLVNFNNDSNPQNLPRGITVDQNALLYIYSNEDGKTHVYDNTDKNETATSCSLQ